MCNNIPVSCVTIKLNDHFNPIHDLDGEIKKKTTKMLPLSVSKARLNVGPFQIIRVRHIVT